MTSSGMRADDFIVARFDTGATQNGLYYEFLAFAPDVRLNFWTFCLLAFRQMHGRPGNPARLRVEAAARARGDR